MRGNQDPRNVPPALPLGDQGSIGYKHGLQSSEAWLVGETDNRQICDQLLAVRMWRVSVFCSPGILLNVVYGSSRTRQINSLRGPLVFYAPGQVAVYAVPSVAGRDAANYAYCTATPVSSAQPSGARFTLAGAHPFPDDAARFFALAASVVSIDGNAVALAIGQSVPLIAGSSLTSGFGYVEFES